MASRGAPRKNAGRMSNEAALALIEDWEAQCEYDGIQEELEREEPDLVIPGLFQSAVPVPQHAATGDRVRRKPGPRRKDGMPDFAVRCIAENKRKMPKRARGRPKSAEMRQKCRDAVQDVYQVQLVLTLKASNERSTLR